MNIRSLEFSPDRKWLAFREVIGRSQQKGIWRILIVDVEKHETRTLLEDVLDLNDSSASAANIQGWTPSGDLLIRRRGTGRVAEIPIVPVNGGPPRSIAIPTFAPSAPGDLESDLIVKWSPDGRSMVLARVNRGRETFVIENPLAAVRVTTARADCSRSLEYASTPCRLTSFDARC